MANWALAACHEIGGFFQRACTLRSTSQMSLVAASSLGKWPRTRTALRTCALRLSIALVVYRILRSSGANAKNGITCSQLRRQLWAIAGYFSPGAAVEIFQPLPRHRGRFGLVDRFERQRHRPAFLPCDEVHRVTDEMHDTGLDDRPWKHRGDGLGEAFESIAHRDQDFLGPAVAQIGHHPQPEFRAFGLLDPQPKDFFVARATHANRQVHRLLTMPSL
jgi:hypothetical protein